MLNLLKLLIFKLRTVDGKSGSGEKIRNALIKQEMGYDKGDHDEEAQTKLVDAVFVNQTLIKYKMMKIRAKISFIAL